MFLRAAAAALVGDPHRLFCARARYLPPRILIPPLPLDESYMYARARRAGIRYRLYTTRVPLGSPAEPPVRGREDLVLFLRGGGAWIRMERGSARRVWILDGGARWDFWFGKLGRKSFFFIGERGATSDREKFF